MHELAPWQLALAHEVDQDVAECFEVVATRVFVALMRGLGEELDCADAAAFLHDLNVFASVG